MRHVYSKHMLQEETLGLVEALEAVKRSVIKGESVTIGQALEERTNRMNELLRDRYSSITKYSKVMDKVDSVV